MATTALTVRDVCKPVEESIKKFQETGELRFPADYSPENALKSAALILQETQDRNKRPVLEVCTRASITSALLSMAVQGLNPDKKQGYFIAYGDKLVFQRSYFGSMALAKRVDPTITDIYADVVYADDGFEYAKKRGKTIITSHTQRLANIGKGKIIAAYATVLRGEDETSAIMTMEEIEQAWQQSPTHPLDEQGNIKASSTHGKFTAEMAKKTVLNRACKPIINASSDATIVKYVREQDDAATQAEVKQEIAEHANTVELDSENVHEADETPVVDHKTGEVKEDTPADESASDGGADKKAPY